MKNITVEWTGSYPSLCSGEWAILIDGIRLTGLGSDYFNTYGTYSGWYFVDWVEHFEDYECGEQFEDWDTNTNGLQDSLKRHGIHLSPTEWEYLYDEINKQDWRHGSCGGCI